MPPTPTLDSLINTQNCTHNTSPSTIYTIHYCMALSLHTSSSTASHLTKRQSLSATHLSEYTITDNSTLYIKHTQYTMYCMLTSSYSTLLPYWTVCLLEHTLYSTFRLSMTTSYLTPGYHSNTEETQDCTPYCTQCMYAIQHIIPIQQTPNTVCLIEHTHCSGLARYCVTHTVNKTGQVHEHTECTGLDKYMNTQSTQDWKSTCTHTQW